MRKFRYPILLILALSVFCVTAGRLVPAWRAAVCPSVKVEQAGVCRVVSSIYFKGTVYSESARELRTAEQARIIRVEKKVGDRIVTGDVIMEAETAETVPGVYSALGSDAVSVFRELTGLAESRAETEFCMSEDGRIVIKSPMDGIVCSIPVSEGDTVSTGALCAAVMDNARLSVRAQVDEIYVQEIREGLRCEITGEAFRDRTYHGTVEQIMPFAETAQTLNGKGNTTVEVLIGITDPDEALRSGYSARVEVITGEKDRAVTAPYEAVGQDEDGQEFVYVYRNGRAEKRRIRTGAEMEHRIEVVSGLAGDEWVILDRDTVSFDGMAVKAAAA